MIKNLINKIKKHKGHLFKIFFALAASRWNIIKFNIKKFIDIIFLPFKFYYNKLRYKPIDMTNDEALEVIAGVWPDKGNICTVFINPQIDNSLDLSIVIPVFNNDKYIEKCLQSVLTQETQFKYHIILIDDGSTDKTPEIIEKYKSDTRLTIMHQENQGQSVARNRAFEYCNGKFLMFVDGDDILYPDAVENLLRTAYDHNCDIVEGDFKYFTDEKYLFDKDSFIEISSSKTEFYSYKENPEFVLKTFGYSPIKVYRREMWDNIRFPEHYIFEDIITKFLLRRMVTKYAKINSVVYGYRLHDGSSSHSKKSPLKYLDAVWVLPHVLKMCLDIGIPNDYVYYQLILESAGFTRFIVIHQTNEEKIAKSALVNSRHLLINASEYRCIRPLSLWWFLERSIIDLNYQNWIMVSKLIKKYIRVY